MDHFLEQPNLYKPRQDREEQAGRQAQIDKGRAPDVAVYLVDIFLHAVSPIEFSGKGHT